MVAVVVSQHSEPSLSRPAEVAAQGKALRLHGEEREQPPSEPGGPRGLRLWLRADALTQLPEKPRWERSPAWRGSGAVPGARSGLPPGPQSAPESKQPKRQEVGAASSLRLANGQCLSHCFQYQSSSHRAQAQGRGHRSPLSIGEFSEDPGATFTHCCKGDIKWSGSATPGELPCTSDASNP